MMLFEWMAEHLHIHFDGVLFALPRKLQGGSWSGTESIFKSQRASSRWTKGGKQVMRAPRVVESAANQQNFCSREINSMSWKKEAKRRLNVSHREIWSKKKCFIYKVFALRRKRFLYTFIYFFNLFSFCDGVTSGNEQKRSGREWSWKIANSFTSLVLSSPVVLLLALPKHYFLQWLLSARPESSRRRHGKNNIEHRQSEEGGRKEWKLSAIVEMEAILLN